MTHTPGPWRANGVQIDGPDGMLAECGFGMRKDDETLANAQLIAAAPDLLAELEHHVQGLSAMDGALTPWAAERLAKSKAAIAAAKGEAVSA